MLIVMNLAPPKRNLSVADTIRDWVSAPHVNAGSDPDGDWSTGNQGRLDPVQFEIPAGRASDSVSKPYKLVTLDLRPRKTRVVKVGEASIGG